MFGFKVGERIQITDVTRLINGSDVFEDGDITTVENIVNFHGTPLLLVKPTIDVGDPDFLFPLSFTNEGGFKRLDVVADHGGLTVGETVIIQNIDAHPIAGEYLREGDITTIKTLSDYLGMPVVYVEPTIISEDSEDDAMYEDGIAFSGLDIEKMIKRIDFFFE